MEEEEGVIRNGDERGAEMRSGEKKQKGGYGGNNEYFIEEKA